MTKDTILAARDEARRHLTGDLLPFWLTRCRDDVNGGFITHYDRHGRDTGEDQKSLIAQTRSVYTMSAAHRAGYGGGVCADFARHGVDFLLAKMRDPQHGGFYWTVDRRGNVQSDKKILYGLSFAIYALSEYTLATGDTRGIEQAQATFDLVQRHCADPEHGGYFEMFERDWTRCGPGSGGGRPQDARRPHAPDGGVHDPVRVHGERGPPACAGGGHRDPDPPHSASRVRHRHPAVLGRLARRAPNQVRHRLGLGPVCRGRREAPRRRQHILRPQRRVRVAAAARARCARRAVGAVRARHAKQLDHAVKAGIDDEYGGVYVEGPHDGGPAYDTEKEFWQQAETLVGMLDGCLAFGMDPYWKAYVQVHRFVFDKLVNREVGEWWPLLSRDGNTQIWTHMSHSWKINYHSVRSMIQSIARLETLLAR